MDYNQKRSSFFDSAGTTIVGSSSSDVYGYPMLKADCASYALSFAMPALCSLANVVRQELFLVKNLDKPVHVLIGCGPSGHEADSTL